MKYPEHDPMELEPYYCQHIEAMTAEELHGKSDIAIQLAWRDKEIAELRAKVQWFVEKAADERLDGYRELGQKAATAEQKCDELAVRIRELEDFETGIRQTLENNGVEIKHPHPFWMVGRVSAALTRMHELEALLKEKETP